jgi:hypothetical protein
MKGEREWGNSENKKELNKALAEGIYRETATGEP